MLDLDILSSVVPRSRFLGDTGVPLPEFQADIYKFWGAHQIFQFLPVKLNSINPSILFIFYLNLSSMSIVLAREGV